MTLKTVLLAGGMLMGLGAVAANATVIADDPNDPQIFVQQSGTSPAGGDPNLILTGATNPFVIGVAGSATLQNPTLLIIASYNGTGATPSVSCVSGCAGVSAALVGTYGLTSNHLTGFSSGVAYDALGLTAGGSLSFGNMSGGDVGIGLAAPTSFTLNVYALNGSLTGGASFTLTESGAPRGSYIFGYSCNAPNAVDAACNTNGDIGQTPFTNPGLVNDGGTPPPPPPPPKIAEPGALWLLGVGMLGLAFVRRKGSPPSDA